MIPGRHGSSAAYRYGYQGSEKDDELKGEGNSYYTHHCLLDPRIGKWFSTDPEENEIPSQSPYVSMDNNPVKNNHPDGDIVPQVIGAAVDYGTQVATNVMTGKENVFTENINLTSIAVSAAEGFLTSGASAGRKLIVKATAATINNIVEVKTKKGGGLDKKVNTKIDNLIKNTALDLTVDNLIGQVGGGKFIKEKVNSGTVASATKKVLKKSGVEITRKRNDFIKKTSKQIVDGIKPIQIGVKAGTNQTRDKSKDATDRK